MRLSRNAFLSVAVVLLSVAVGVLAQGSPGRDRFDAEATDVVRRGEAGDFHPLERGVDSGVCGRHGADDITRDVSGGAAERRIRRSGTEGPRPLGKSQHPELYPISMLVEGSAAARYQAEHYPGKPYEWFVEQFRDDLPPGWT